MPENKEPQSKSIFGPEGLVMLTIGILLDLVSIICVVLIIVFGVGLVLAKIVYFVGLVVFATWVFIRSGSISEKAEEKAGSVIRKLFKKQGKKLAFKAIPAIGDAAPMWTITIYSELTGKPVLPKIF